MAALVIRENGITRLGCWAHARIKFFDAFESSQGKCIGKSGLKVFKKLNELEDGIRDMKSSDRFIFRLEMMIPISK